MEVTDCCHMFYVHFWPACLMYDIVIPLMLRTEFLLTYGQLFLLESVVRGVITHGLCILCKENLQQKIPK